MTDPKSTPAQQQEPPGRTDAMGPQAGDEMADYRGRDLLVGRRALITGGDSGIGRAVAVAFAKEGAEIAARTPTRRCAASTPGPTSGACGWPGRMANR